MPRAVGQSYYSEVPVSLAARTTNGSQDVAGDFGEVQALVVYFRVTAVSGTTPQIVFSLADGVDGTNYTTLATGSNITATGFYVLRVPVTTPFGNRLRISWVITGTTPSFTFEVTVVSQMGNS